MTNQIHLPNNNNIKLANQSIGKREGHYMYNTIVSKLETFAFQGWKNNYLKFDHSQIHKNQVVALSVTH